MSYSDISRDGVEAAPALEFDAPPPPPYALIEITTTVLVEGYTFTVTFRDTSLSAALDALKKRGCQPAGQGKEHTRAESPGQVSDTADLPSGAAPACPIHGKAMRQGKGGWYCATRLKDDTWCKERA